jgi:tetratricopeptide (TPR) repeat protein
LGAAAYEQGFPEEAEAAFREVLTLEPQNVEAQFGLGTLMLARKEYDRAITTLEPLTLTETPHDAAAFNLAQAYMAKDRKEEAQDVLDALANRSPEHPKVQFTLALVFEVLGDVGQAEAAYRREIQVRPGFVPAYLNLAALLEKEGRSEEAVEQLRLALAQSSEASQAEKIRAAITAMEESE